MNDNHVITISLVAVIAILGPVLIGIGVGLSPVFYLIVALILLAVTGVFTIRWLSQRQPRPVWIASPASRAPVGPIDLPSEAADYRFHFSATVSWERIGNAAHHDPAALAHESIVTRAAAISERYALTDRGLVEHRLAAALGEAEPDTHGRVRAWATGINLTLDGPDADRLRSLANLRKSVEVWEHERRHEINIRSYLMDDALSSAGSTLVWWLARDGANIDDAVPRLSSFARISAVAQGREESAQHGPQGFVESDLHTVRRLIDQLMPHADEDEHRMLAEHLAKAIDAYGFADLGKQLRDSYDLQQVEEPTPSDSDLPGEYEH